MARTDVHISSSSFMLCSFIFSTVSSRFRVYPPFRHCFCSSVARSRFPPRLRSLRSVSSSTLVNAAFSVPVGDLPDSSYFLVLRNRNNSYGAQQSFQQPGQQNAGAYNGQGY